MQAFHIYNLLSFLQKFIGKQKSLIEIAACIISKVEDQPFHAC